MKREGDGHWGSKVKLPSGLYEYKHLADTAWIERLPNSKTVVDPFGLKEFIVSVKGEEIDCVNGLWKNVRKAFYEERSKLHLEVMLWRFLNGIRNLV
jgi:hypothetical protein